MKLQFTGHESFICKQLWLKKGYDFVASKGDFNSENAIIELGVGKNMVASISYWLKAFGIIDNYNAITELGHFLFHSQTGVDPYIENFASIWLLHYSLIKTNKASVYHLFFNEFRKGRTEFTKAQLLSFIKWKYDQLDQRSSNDNTIMADLNVFIRNYLKPTSKGYKIDIEEDFSSLLIDLDIMQSFRSGDDDENLIDWYKVENKLQTDIPGALVLFSILDNTYEHSISFRELLTGKNSPGAVFLFTDEGLYHKLVAICNKEITLSESAGTRELQFKTKPSKWTILNEYYRN